MSDNLRQLIQRLAKDFSAEDNAAHDLWTWLPSYKVAERFHGDKGMFNTPPVHDVLVEASLYICSLKDLTSRDYSSEEKEWFERCPCGEEHTEETRP